MVMFAGVAAILIIASENRPFRGGAPDVSMTNRQRPIPFFTVAASRLQMPLKLPGWFAARPASRVMNCRAGSKRGR